MGTLLIPIDKKRKVVKTEFSRQLIDHESAAFHILQSIVSYWIVDSTVDATEASADTYSAIDGATYRASRVVERTISRAKDIPAINVPVLRRLAA